MKLGNGRDLPQATGDKNVDSPLSALLRLLKRIVRSIILIESLLGGAEMPEISLFLGIRITMYWNDHMPPHFHAQYAEHKAAVSILDGTVIEGGLPNRQLKYVLAWAELHKDELMQNWELGRDNKDFQSIDPLR